MAITISGENNNDRILASDGVLDSISGINAVGVVTATSFTGALTGDVTGNVVGNLTGNVNHTSNLLFQIGGSEKVRLDTSGRLLIGTTTEGYAGAPNLTIADTGNCGITIRSGASNQGTIAFSDAESGAGEYDGFLQYSQADRELKVGTASAVRFTVTSGGHVVPYVDSTYDLGTTSKRWRNVYTDHISVAGVSTAIRYDVNFVNAEIKLTTNQSSFTRYGAINHYHNNSSTIHNQIKLAPRNGGTGRIMFYNLTGGSLTERLRIDGIDGIQAIAHITPMTDSTYNLGSNGTRFANVYADTLYGDGSNLTGITQTTINSNADNRIITGSGTANTLNGESSFTYNAGLLIQSNSNGDVQTQMNATSGDAKIVLDNSGNGNYSGIDFERERSSGAGVNGGSIFMKSDTSNNNALLYIQAQSASAQAPVTSALSNDNGVRLLLRGGEGIFSVEPGSAERLRLDTNGRLGLSHNLSGTADYNRLMLHNPHSGSCWMQMTSTATGSSANTDGLSIGLNTSNIAHFWLRENAEMQFATNGTKRWTITNTGDLIPGGNYNIGLNSNVAFRMQEVNSVKFVHRYGTSGSATNNQQEAIWYGGGITTMHDNLTLSTTNYTWGLTGVRGYALIRIRNGAGSPQAIYAEAGSISSGSDYRMKENIEEITNGIETVKKLKPSIYNIRKTFNPNDDGKKHHGFVAHEVQEAIPDIGNIVSGTKDAMEEVFYEDEDENIPAGKKPGDSTGTFTDKPDYQGIDYGHMTPVLAAAIKELITKVETLEAEVATLKGS
jgi:hypothetical protein